MPVLRLNRMVGCLATGEIRNGDMDTCDGERIEVEAAAGNVRIYVSVLGQDDEVAMLG